MTVDERRNWSEAGQGVAVLTLLLLAFGAVAALAQSMTTDQGAINMQQATAVATLSAQMASLTERMAKLESQINYVLMALVGSLITQLVQLRVGGKR